MTLDRIPQPAQGPARHKKGLTRQKGLQRHRESERPGTTDAPQFPGTIAAAFTRLNATAATRLGVSPEKYANLVGMAPEHLADDRYRTPASTNVRIWELMTLQAPWHEVSLHMAHESPLGALGLWDYLVTQAPTPLTGLRDAARFVATVADAGTEALHIDEDEQHITLSHINAADLSDDVASAIRTYSLSLFRPRISESTRRDITPIKVTLAARAPRTHQNLVQLYGTRAIDFSSPVNTITFRAADLTAPQPHVPGLSTLLRRHAEQQLADAIPLQNWLDIFRAALRTTQDAEIPTLKTVSRQMSCSTRTLQRRLEEHRTTWSQELQALRRERTHRLLSTTDLPLSSIAGRVGYADAGGLRRAVQRWTAQPVAAVRARNDDCRPAGPTSTRESS
ncbi:AraC family transcriptional regulator [Streptomyces sp. B1I3]|uniref:helix-turn-helix domain-containing protein n=1 Tax=Streptomyces sp. B1I3 TaxID=3042264 RepID=UPI00277F6790|nr:AraC family transcriptional regulator ligand-binding domain-containing protein [Streptomyces sp. B1I3]MDQ0791543.1 AraC-like DNA-binding protein [Streptomyces sp. B1I3]